MVVVDTGALLALLDADEQHHAIIRALYEAEPDQWILPWAILPEVDYLAGRHLGARARDAFLGDLAAGAFLVDWGGDADLDAVHRIHSRHRGLGLGLGLVDAAVIATAERLKVRAIATLDLRHFGAVTIAGAPRLLPRDAARSPAAPPGRRDPASRQAARRPRGRRPR